MTTQHSVPGPSASEASPTRAAPEPSPGGAGRTRPSVPAQPEAEGDEPAAGRRWWRPDLLTTVGVLAFVLFALGTVGSPLWGGSVLAATDEMQLRSPYQDVGFAGIPVQNTYMDDTYNAVMPDTILFANELKEGRVAAWNPYVVGGVPLGAIPTLGLANPLTLPYYLLPDALAPGYVKLLETVFCGIMTFLFLRRLRLGRPAAVLGGLVFASSAFMIMWTNWPHTRTAAFIPAVFWAVERLVQERRVRDATLISLAVGGMLAGGFPAVTAFTLFTAAPYLLVRAVAAYPGQVRRVLALVGGAAAGLAGAVALVAFQLLPFARAMSQVLIAGREQQPDEHLSAASLITSIAPWALGTVAQARPPEWYLPVNLVESMSYVGAAGLVLVVVAVATPWAARAFLPRGTWTFLIAALGLWVAVIYTAPGAGVAHHLPVFSTNFVGRARSVVWLLIAALAAIGLEVVLRRRAASAVAGRRGPRRWYAAGVCAAFGAAGLVILYQAREATGLGRADAAQRAERMQRLDGELLIGVTFLAVAVAAVVLAWWSGGRRRPVWGRVRVGAAATLPVLAAAQALTLTVPYLPRVDRDTFYPVTETHSYLMANLGHERFAGTWTGMQIGADSQLRLRALSGHQFVNRRFAELVQGIPTKQLESSTWLDLPARADVATSPVLDRLGVRYFVTSPSDRVFGRRTPAPKGGEPVVVGAGPSWFTAEGPLRAVVIRPVGPLPTRTPDATVTAVLTDSTGREVARSQRLATGLVHGQPFDFPVAAEDVPSGSELTVEFSTSGLGGPVRAEGIDGQVALETVTAAGDGLRLVQSFPAVVYQRLDAAPRIRWASEAIVEPDGATRVDREASGSLRPDQVLLDTPGPPAGGAPATLRVDEDGADRIEVSVSARGAGYLVVADAIQGQFRASVDGEPAELRPADHGLVAVAVPAGEHVVRVEYVAPYANLGGWVSMLMVVALVVVVVAGRVRDRRRSTSEGFGAARRGQIVTSR